MLHQNGFKRKEVGNRSLRELLFNT